jgi:hypothetical protein
MENEQPKTRKVIDWIKYKNIKDASKNYSALKGLKRVNKILYRFIKWGLIGFVVSIGSISYYKYFQEITQNGIKNFESKLNALDNKERFYLLKHQKLSLEYGNIKNIIRSEDKIGITYYREKLLKNASGLVLETCKKNIIRIYEIINLFNNI